MPFMKDGKRDYAAELKWENERARHRLKDRVMRHKARREVEAKVGNLPSSKHVDHKKELTRGGSNSASNLRVVSAKTNLAKEGRRKAGK
jgi:5-methylcytosine-specific restriction endonuclease McrA